MNLINIQPGIEPVNPYWLKDPTTNYDPIEYCLVLFAGDNGISEENISAYLPFSSGDIVLEHINGRAPTASLLQQLNKLEYIIDVGLKTPVPGTVNLNIRQGTANFLFGDALERVEVEQAINIGAGIYNTLSVHKFDIIGIGEIGVADTLCASAIITVISGISPASIVGPGSAGDKVYARKVDIINRALKCRQVFPFDTIDLLSRFGGLEIAALAGFILEAARSGMWIMLDGYVTSVAALLATGLDSQADFKLLTASLSAEPGHLVALKSLKLSPLINLGIHYGEGLSAALGMCLWQCGCTLS
ncbi:MAG: nicotinate-nucleotide--dimethylbenzimidazole phosphoribosyltransferase [Syntrophomonadaceae bacterium]